MLGRYIPGRMMAIARALRDGEEQLNVRSLLD